jgi:thiol-disulfide isomerase/thioredoxin
VAKTLEKGEAALAAKKFDAALQEFKKADQQSKGNSGGALWGMARAYHGLGDYKAETANCTAALRLVGGDPAKESELRLARAIAMYAGAKSNADGALKNAETELRAVLLLPHSGPLIDFYLGMAILRIGGRDEEGLQRLDASITRGLQAPELDLAKRAIANPRSAGEMLAPPFTVTTRDGKSIANTDLAGKTVLLDFWGTWCAPCRQSTPGLVELHSKFADQPFVMIGISSDAAKDESKWKKYIDEHQMDWVQFLDLKKAAITPFAVHAYPTFVVIGPDGAIRLRFSGYGPGAMTQLERAIAASFPR